jgi:uncharacterized protein YwgA
LITRLKEKKEDILSSKESEELISKLNLNEDLEDFDEWLKSKGVN